MAGISSVAVFAEESAKLLLHSFFWEGSFMVAWSAWCFGPDLSIFRSREAEVGDGKK